MRVFVYGTLKRNHGNWRYYLKNNSTYLGEYETDPNFTLISLGAFPGVLLHGNNSIKGELFEVSDVQFSRIDRLEGYPSFYNRIEIETPHGPSWMYYLDREQYESYPEVESGEW